MLLCRGNEKIRGYILVVVLLFLQIFSLIGIYMDRHASQIIRKQADNWEEYLKQSVAEKISRGIEKNIYYGMDSCVLPVMSPAEWRKKSISWWEHHTCSDSDIKIRYHYAIEYLGWDACAVINTNSDLLTKTGYYRVTLMLMELNKVNANYLLQTTVAVPANETTICKDKIHIVQEGRQMQRELI